MPSNRIDSVPYTTPLPDVIAPQLQDFVGEYPRLFVLTGAGCSTDSGIPDYRDADGAWKRKPPVMFQAFMRDVQTRQRYWARSLIGWQRFGHAAPNAAHRALAKLEADGRMQILVTQNVDGLHQTAGSRHVIDLHGRLDQVRCMACEARTPRADFQAQLLELNPDWAHLSAADFARFEVPACPHCGGLLKPDVVFYGENVPPARVDMAMQHLREADALLIVGSSLMVYSGYRFAVAAAEQGKPIAAINLGRTRADELLSAKFTESCSDALAFLLES